MLLPLPRSARVAKTLALGAICVWSLPACQQRAVEFEGLPGVPIAMAADDARDVPRLAFVDESCPGTPGGCASYCTDDPATCLAADSNACMPAIIATASPLTFLPSQGGGVSTGRECFEVRAAEGLGIDPALEDPLAVARFRFEDPPVLRAPADAPQGWSWFSGDDRAPYMGVGALIGGNLLNDFAVELRHDPVDPQAPTEIIVPTVTFSRGFPGSQRALADQGRAYIRLQYPNRLTGVMVRDQCEFEGGDCQLPELDINEGRFRTIHERFRMTVDACIAPGPCEAIYDVQSEGESPCALRKGAGNPLTCAAADGSALGGRGASLVIATEVPGLALVEDSAASLFGVLEDLPDCGGDLGELPSEVLACVESPNTGALAIPGWTPLEQLMVLRVRAVALVTGSRSASAPGPGDQSQAPCARVLARLSGVREQCNAVVDEGEPFSPRAGQLEQRGSADARIDVAVFQTGEVAWDADQDEPDTSRWVRTLVLPADAPFVEFTRRDTAGESAQPDGFIGGALLRNTEVVLDYTESDAQPGVRVTCLDPGTGTCLSVPSCAGGNNDQRSESCCYGLPQNLLSQTIQAGADKPQPRVEDECCRALNPRALATLQTEGDFCANVDPL